MVHFCSARWDNFTPPFTDAFGCYTNPSTTYANRLSIIGTAQDLVDDAANIGYTLFNALKCDDSSNIHDWDGTLTDVSELRCDGLISVCYETNGINVWAMERDYSGTSYNYDISNQSDSLTYNSITRNWSSGSNNAKDNLEEHNDFDDIGWADTLMPATQCGHTTPSDADTTFTAQNLCVPIGHTGGN